MQWLGWDWTAALTVFCVGAASVLSMEDRSGALREALGYGLMALGYSGVIVLLAIMAIPRVVGY